MATIEELKKERKRIHQELAILEDTAFKKKHRAAVGKYYKISNSYSLPETPADYWWLYYKVIAVKESHLRAWKFQKDCDNKIEIEFDTDFRSIDIAKEISMKEFQQAWKKLKEEINQRA